MATKWIEIGTIPVDSGKMMLVDPCYVRDGIDYGHIIAGRKGNGNLTSLRENDEAVIPLAAVFDTGIGDGLYPVELEIDEDGYTVCAARIIFLEESDAA